MFIVCKHKFHMIGLRMRQGQR